MSSSLCFTRIPHAKPGIIVIHPIPTARKAVWIKGTIWKSKNPQIRSFEVKAAADASDNDKNSKKIKTIFCPNCEGNGAVSCSQCKGSGVNPIDYFNGQFKTGANCWLCGGRRDMLCGDCNGAGFLGGFMSTFDE